MQIQLIKVQKELLDAQKSLRQKNEDVPSGRSPTLRIED